MRSFNPFALTGSAYDAAVLCCIFMFGGFAVTTSGLILTLVSTHYFIFAGYGMLGMAASAAAWSLILAYDKRARATRA